MAWFLEDLNILVFKQQTANHIFCWRSYSISYSQQVMSKSVRAHGGHQDWALKTATSWRLKSVVKPKTRRSGPKLERERGSVGSALHKKKPFFSALHKLIISEGKSDVINVLSPKWWCVSVPYKFPPKHSFCINSSSQSHMTEQPRLHRRSEQNFTFTLITVKCQRMECRKMRMVNNSKTF